ncbi:hypothetical protein VF13_39185 [Nostoc linckia z16]|nr:hypothetical protein VF13_39185 [Nostoc linckia z16]
MTAEPNKPSSQVKLINFLDIEWHIADISSIGEEWAETKPDLSVGLAITHRVVPNKKLICIRCFVQFSQEEAVFNEDFLLKYITEAHFELTSFEEIISVDPNDNERYRIPTELLHVLTGVTISTTRGLLISKTSSSYFNYFYLPILSPTDITNLLTS